MTENFTTTNAGAPAPSDEHSLTVGPDGPVLLQDFYLIEQLAAFNRERVPERQPHAKGTGAFGRFEVTNDLSAYTKAAVFQPGAVTDVFVRLATNAGERGSADTQRDTRGFSVKFYTSEGNFDLVGLDFPVFVIRDPLKFPQMVRSAKTRANNGCHDHNMQWDFWTLSPESAHQVTMIMSDRGIPKTFRNMHGFGLHAFSFLNAAGEISWVKFHFKSNQGIEWLTQEEGDRLAGTDPDFCMRDLYEAIERGEYPSWSVKVQIMPFEEAKTYRFNPFDVTKVWPHADYPLVDLGTMTLDRNIADHHTEVEQATFAPPRAGARHRVEPGQAVARAQFRLRRCPPPPRRGQSQPASGQRPEVPGAQLFQGRADALCQRMRPGVRAQLLWWADSRPRPGVGGEMGRRRGNDGARALHAATR